MAKHAYHVYFGLLIGALIGLTFIADLLAPRGVAAWVLYAFPIFLTLRRESPFTPFLVVWPCIALMAIPVFFEDRNSTPFYFSVINWFSASIVGIVLAFLIRSERKQAELLLHSEQTLRSTFRAAPIGIGIILPGRILQWVNQELSRMTGYSPDELFGKSARMLYFDDAEYERVGREKYADIERDGWGILEAKLRRKDGAAIQVFLSTAAIDQDDFSKGFIFTVLNVTERKRLEAEIQRERNIFHGLAQNSPDVIFIYNLEMRFIYISPMVQRYAGIAPKDFLGKTNEEAGTPDALCRQWRKEFDLVVRTKQSRRFEFAYPTPEGECFFIETDIPLISEGGAIEGVMGFAHDITELKSIQMSLETRARERTRELIAAHRELEQAKRLSDIGSLAATVAHELRNPLGVIKAAVYNIRRKIKDGSIAGQLENIEKKISDSDQIINNLLFYSRFKQLHAESIGLYRLLRESVDSFRKRFNDFNVIEHFDGIKGAAIEGDPLQLAELFNNLLSNARDAVRDCRGNLQVRAWQEETNVRLEFADSGCGIAPGEMKKIFDPFYTSKAKGTGLGLAVSKQIIALHNGTIDIQSEENKGTTVTVILPASQKKIEP